MNDVYKRIWLKDGTLTPQEVEEIDGHDLCYVALLHAREHKITDAQNALKMIDEGRPDHLCPIILEAQALNYLFLREYNAARAFALDALQKQPEAVFSFWVLAQIELIKRKYTNAVEYLRKILELYPESDKSILDIAEALALGKDYKASQQYLEMAKPSIRKKLYIFFIPFFRYWVLRLLWVVIIFALIAVSPYLFIVSYLLTTIFLIYVAIQWGHRRGDRLLFSYPVFIQSINSVFFFVLLCELLDKVAFL